MSQGSFIPKVRFLGQKMWPVPRGYTDGQTEWLLWAPFQGFMIFFPSIYYQGSAQYPIVASTAVVPFSNVCKAMQLESPCARLWFLRCWQLFSVNSQVLAELQCQLHTEKKVKYARKTISHTMSYHSHALGRFLQLILGGRIVEAKLVSLK